MLPLRACDTAHAQAQALDIGRAFENAKYSLSYGQADDSLISELFKKLAFNEFTQQSCELWAGSFVNKSPCFYALGTRFYVRTTILKYLDIPREGVVPKLRCKNPHCINPYHFEYCAEKNTKLSSGDVQMLLAFQSQGASARQIAKVLKVHRSTIYRKLKDERIHSGTSRHLRS